MSTPSEEEHQGHREEAIRLYKLSLDPEAQAVAWAETVAAMTVKTEGALAASDGLHNIAQALVGNGGHMGAFRYLLAPPLSQDQFKLACPVWSKGSETNARPVAPDTAAEIAAIVEPWLDQVRVASIQSGNEHEAVLATALMMAINHHMTLSRMRLASEQEGAVATLLERLGFELVVSATVDQPGVLGPKQFMRTTQFATADGSTHEVDVAIGLPGRKILALECKVSNDSTNSVKRINDVLKKASAWKTQWGKFVTTGALLQGVFGPNEPRRLLDADVEVFWSHSLDALEAWITEQSEG